MQIEGDAFISRPGHETVLFKPQGLRRRGWPRHPAASPTAVQARPLPRPWFRRQWIYRPPLFPPPPRFQHLNLWFRLRRACRMLAEPRPLQEVQVPETGDMGVWKAIQTSKPLARLADTAATAAAAEFRRKVNNLYAEIGWGCCVTCNEPTSQPRNRTPTTSPCERTPMKTCIRTGIERAKETTKRHSSAVGHETLSFDTKQKAKKKTPTIIGPSGPLARSLPFSPLSSRSPHTPHHTNERGRGTPPGKRRKRRKPVVQKLFTTRDGFSLVNHVARSIRFQKTHAHTLTCTIRSSLARQSSRRPSNSTVALSSCLPSSFRP